MTKLLLQTGVNYPVHNCRYCDCTVWAADSGLQSNGKVQPRTGHEGPTGKCWMGVGGQHHASATLPPRRNPYPLYRRLGGPQGNNNNLDWGPVPHFLPPGALQPVWLVVRFPVF